MLRVLLVILLVAVVLYGFNRYVYTPNQQKIRGMQQELMRLTTTLLHVRETVENLPRVRAEYESLQQEWRKLQTMVPETEEVTDLIQQVSVAERKAGVYIISIEPQVPRAKELYTENPYRLRLEGSYHSFARFLSALSAMPRIINVSEIVLSANPNSREENDAITVQCSLTSYTSLKRSG
ncbi:MAG: type 4a pilus biogenesis protein PilO [bacterium]